MATTGYSGTPLLKKLGVQATMKLLLINQPPDYFAMLADGSSLPEKTLKAQLAYGKSTPDLAHLFVTSVSEFETAMKKLAPIYKKNTSLIIWVSWYKKSAKIPTDITEDTIRNYALANGLVDIKVCAVSDSWSGLKLVVPLKNR